MIAGLDWSVLLVCLPVVFVAALVRGYSGFGFSALTIASLSIVIPPVQIVPAILLVEIVAGIGMLPSIWKDIDWRQLRLIGFGALFATPLGLMLLAGLPSQWMRILISVLILICAVLIWRGFRIRGGDRASVIGSAGVVSGALNGAAGVGGLPLVVFFLSKEESAATVRGTLITYLILLDIYTCLLATGSGMIDWQVVQLAALFLIPVGLGTLLGNRHFLKSPPESFRRIALAMLMLISGGSLGRSLVNL
ncbi:sulfite exporter TauE/SafE family protein [Motiliproteus sp.]|uniref:sulfite exporter TauE/SafE family protein n=1 Tax=Motiliproteus sp. TaxID=1898955 RepID=UPI003BA86963